MLDLMADTCLHASGKAQSAAGAVAQRLIEWAEPLVIVQGGSERGRRRLLHEVQDIPQNEGCSGSHHGERTARRKGHLPGVRHQDDEIPPESKGQRQIAATTIFMAG